MLSLKNITKEYPTGDTKVQALRGISLDFRENEFVSILGPSGCGKTTLLNIIGGLDQYTSGDLIINGISTRRYTDADWDTYRNHSIGFVFQSYNLIPHQTVLANVELALTLSGVSKRERRRRAVDALKQVGLGAQIHKKPNQMSGGQMQRVAIARALVNDPDILLADEPTGALDTQTSIQIMDILRSISKKKLIIMVTHNPELARRYSSRIIKVLDGRVVGDSRPYRAGEDSAPAPVLGLFRRKKRSPLAIDPEEARRAQFGGLGGKKRSATGKKKRSMSFFTALSLSLNNLMTKKGRTFMTSFAGSIGIIGIALILSVSSGVNAYIESVQRDTLASYPIELHAESVDLTALVNTLMNSNGDDTHDHDRNKVYESIVLAQLMNALGSTGTESNDLTAFKKHLESSEEFAKYLSAIRYQYDFNWSILVREGNEIGSDAGKVVKSDVAAWLSGMSGSSGSSQSSYSSMMGSSMGGFDVWSEMLSPLDKNDTNLVSSLVREKYELIDEGGRWPEAANEVVLIVDEHNEISDLALFALGLRTEEEMNKVMLAAMKGEPVDLSDRKSWSYEEIKQMRFRLLLASECYEKNADGTYTDLSASDSGLETLYGDADRGFTLRVVGIVRPTDDATSAFMSGSIGYTSALADEAMARTQKLGMLDEQKNSPDIDIITGQPFKSDKVITEEQKRTAIHNYLASLSEAEAKQFLCRVLAPEPSEEQIAAKVAEINAYPDSALRQILSTALETLGQEGVTVDMVMENPQLKSMAIQAIALAMVQEELNQAAFGDKTVAEMEAMLSAAQVDTLYEEDEIPHDYSKSTYQKNLALLGDVNSDSPSAIYLYAATFEDKDEISALIDAYNGTVEESKKISYTDYVGLLMSSVTTIVNAISYVLIAFVAISLVVSSIMIGIITYISVLERTKEIGILRAIGASKKDVGRVFNAETLIVGFVAGVIGIVITLLLNQVVNVILFHFTGIAGLRAVLPVGAAIILVAISMFLTFIAGLIPSGFAAKKNPVEALRSE
ncbi:MAG TPA: ABC transporter [Clostridiales bacterium]|nr:ABC transporter [Clostridiales bacterium]